MLEAKRIPQAPPAVRGAFDFRGEPAQEHLSTRIVLVNYPDGRGGTRLLGLLAEHVTETMRRNAEDFHDPGVEVPDAPWLGPVASDAGGLVQWVRVEQLLPDDLR